MVLPVHQPDWAGLWCTPACPPSEPQRNWGIALTLPPEGERRGRGSQRGRWQGGEKGEVVRGSQRGNRGVGEMVRGSQTLYGYGLVAMCGYDVKPKNLLVVSLLKYRHGNLHNFRVYLHV